MNTARVDAEHADGRVETLHHEPLDQLDGLYHPLEPHATVGISVGTQVNFGQVKVTAHVSYTCDQNQRTVDQAGLLAFEKAVSFMNDGIALLTGPVPT